MTSRSPFRAISTVAVVAAGVLALTGCSGTGGARPSATPTAKPVGTPVTQTCGDLVPTDTFTVYGKDFTLDRDAEPAKGTPAAVVAAQRGRVCVFVDHADDIRVTVAVAHLPEKSLTQLKDALYEQSRSVPTYGVEGYFVQQEQQGIGRADSFVDPYWVNATSSMFGEPGDAEPVMDAVRTALG